MADLSIARRVQFPKGEQDRFLEKILAKISVDEAALACQISSRTIRDWRRGRFFINLGALTALCRKTKTPFPRNVKLVEQYWYTSKGARRGWEVTKKKYGKVPGDEEYRKRRWHAWWEKEGKHEKSWAKISKSFPIKRPGFSEELAEFVGIILGDGHIADYQVMVILNSEKEKEYTLFVVALMKRLFKVPSAIYYRKNVSALNLVVSRVELVRFCVGLGLRKGNKVAYQADIPTWIKSREQYLIACVRGLMDTDGTVFPHRYKVNGKWYSYKKLSFTSHSKPLRESMFLAMKNLGFYPRRSGDFDIRLERVDDVRRYFRTIGTHNEHHLKRYRD